MKTHVPRGSDLGLRWGRSTCVLNKRRIASEAAGYLTTRRIPTLNSPGNAGSCDASG